MKRLVGAISRIGKSRSIDVPRTSSYQGVSNRYGLWYARTNPVRAYHFDSQSA